MPLLACAAALLVCWVNSYELSINADDDGDGISNSVEALLLEPTSPLNADTDGDLILDGDEDADGDGLSNAVELMFWSNPGIDQNFNGIDDCEE